MCPRIYKTLLTVKRFPTLSFQLYIDLFRRTLILEETEKCNGKALRGNSGGPEEDSWGITAGIFDVNTTFVLYCFSGQLPANTACKLCSAFSYKRNGYLLSLPRILRGMDVGSPGYLDHSQKSANYLSWSNAMNSIQPVLPIRRLFWASIELHKGRLW